MTVRSNSKTDLLYLNVSSKFVAFLLDIGITLTLVTCLIRLVIILWPTIVLSAKAASDFSQDDYARRRKKKSVR